MTGNETLVAESPLKRVFRNSGWLLVGQVTAAGMLFIQMILLTRTLSIAEFGIYALVMTVTMTVIQLCDCRVWEALIKFIPRYQARYELPKAAAILQLCLLLELITGIVAFALIFLGGELFTRLFGESLPDAGDLRIAAWLAIANIPHEPLTALLRLADYYRGQAVYRVVLATFRLLFSLLVWATEPSVSNFLLAELVSRLLGSLFLVGLAVRVLREEKLTSVWSGWRVGLLRDDRGEIRSFLGLSYLTGNLRMVTSKADTLILGLVSSPATIGLYELAKRVIEQILGLTRPLAMAIFPETSRFVARGETEELRQLHRKFSFRVMILVVPCCAIFTVIAPWVFPFIGGVEYRQSSLLGQILIWQLLWLPMVWFSGYLLALGELRMMLRLLLIDTVVFVGMLVPLVFWSEATGAAIATTSRALLWATMARMVSSRLRETARTTSVEDVLVERAS